MKLEVGKYYELNNGSMHKCTKMIGDDPHAVDESGYGPFVIDGMCYHQDGRWADYASHDPLSVRRCVEPARDPELTSPHGDNNHPLPDTKTGTLKELGVKAGDIVECVGNEDVPEFYIIGERYTVGGSDEMEEEVKADEYGGEFILISRAIDTQQPRASVSPDHSWEPSPDTPKTWGEMTDAEKLEKIEALGNWMASNADHRGVDLFNDLIDAINPEPKREIEQVLILSADWTVIGSGTVETENGKPDCASIKMERIND